MLIPRFRALSVSCRMLAVIAVSLAIAPGLQGTLSADDKNTARTPGRLTLKLRERVETPSDSGKYRSRVRTEHWIPKQTAVVVCDMWDDHTCKAAASRVAEMAPAVDRLLAAARRQGVLIVHAPSGTTSFYDGTPARKRAIEAPPAKTPVALKWNYWDDKREGAPLPFIRAGGCGCKIPCRGWVPDETGLRHWKGGKVPWIRQIDTIQITNGDAVSSDGQEIYNLFQHRGIENVVLLGVHTNLCVCGRPFGLRQMTYLGKNVVLCRDLTDSLFQPKTQDFDHFEGTDLVVEHIEARICPTISSSEFTNVPTFRFKQDHRAVR